MNDSFSNSTNNDENELSISALEQQIKFYVLLILQTPSLLITIFIFYHFKWSDIKVQTYGFLLISNGLIVSVELSFTIYFLHEGTIYSKSICTFWIIVNYSLFELNLFLMVLISIERYLFIYHDRFISRHIILLHYVPVVIISLYIPLFYIGIVGFYSCKPFYDVTLYVCGGPCYSLEPVLGSFDWFGNNLSIEVLIVMINILVILRYVIRRHQMRRIIVTRTTGLELRRSTKLGFQLLTVTLLFILTYAPYSIVVLIQMYTNDATVIYISTRFLVYTIYLEPLLFPGICMTFMPNVKTKFLKIFKLNAHRVQPINNNE